MQILWKATLAEAMSSIWSNLQKMQEKESLDEFLQCKNNWRKSVTKKVGKKAIKPKAQNEVKG